MIHSNFLIGGDLLVNRIGMGTMRLCGQPGNFGPYTDWNAGLRLLRFAKDRGINFFDTAHAYGPGWNEALLGEAFSDSEPGPVIATKGGVEKTAPDKVFPDGRPSQLRLRCEESLQRLRVERIDLYQLHRPDPALAFTESVGALADLRSEGKIRHVGLSNVTLEQLILAMSIVPIASVQNRYNVQEQTDTAVLEHCTLHGIAYLPWGPLAAVPFNKEAPLSTDARLKELAHRHHATAGQLALAWLLHRAPNIIIIPGTTDTGHLKENIECGRLQLSQSDLAEIEAATRM